MLEPAPQYSKAKRRKLWKTYESIFIPAVAARWLAARSGGAADSVPQGQPSIPGRPRASKAVLQTLTISIRSIHIHASERWHHHRRRRRRRHNNNNNNNTSNVNYIYIVAATTKLAAFTFCSILIPLANRQHNLYDIYLLLCI